MMIFVRRFIPHTSAQPSGGPRHGPTCGFPGLYAAKPPGLPLGRAGAERSAAAWEAARSSRHRVTSAVQPVWWRRSTAAAGLAVEVLVEQHEIAPGGILGEAPVAPVAGAPAGRIGQEEARRGAARSPRRPARGSCVLPEPVGHSTCERVAVEVVVALQRLDQQVVDGEPDRPAPVRVAAEQAGVGLARECSPRWSSCPRARRRTGRSRYTRDRERIPNGERNSFSSSR